MTREPDRPIVAVSLKAYFGPAGTRAWLETVAAIARETRVAERVDVVVLPTFLALADAVAILAGTGVAVGAQDAFWEERGPYTGEVSPADLREVGCSWVAVGHAERRRLFCEDDVTTARKAAAVVRAGMTPLACVGEAERTTPEGAARVVLAQAEAVLAAVPEDADLAFAYEPVWAIGAERPADPAWVGEVAGRLRERLAARPARPRLVYGGSAGPGLYARLAADVDGLFLGRFAHDTENLRAVLAEVEAGARGERQRDRAPDGDRPRGTAPRPRGTA